MSSRHLKTSILASISLSLLSVGFIYDHSQSSELRVLNRDLLHEANVYEKEKAPRKNQIRGAEGDDGFLGMEGDAGGIPSNKKKVRSVTPFLP